jgi:hypothetical protein
MVPIVRISRRRMQKSSRISSNPVMRRRQGMEYSPRQPPLLPQNQTVKVPTPPRHSKRKSSRRERLLRLQPRRRGRMGK